MSKFCHICGFLLKENGSICPECGAEIIAIEHNITVDSTPEEKQDNNLENIKTSNLAENNNNYTKKEPLNNPKSKLTSTLLIVASSLILVTAGLLGYYNIYKPYKIDKEAPRYYTYATNTFLRSTTDSGVDYNKLGTLPYGSELITYYRGDEWAEVKWKNPHTNKNISGYIHSDFILAGDEFEILNEIWGDNDSKEVINTTKCRRALIKYFKDMNLSREWKIFSKSVNTSPNSTYYARLTNKNSKFTDFAVIIKNTDNGERRLLLFRFDEDETPHFVFEETAPESGDIKDIRLIRNKYHINYSE